MKAPRDYTFDRVYGNVRFVTFISATDIFLLVVRWIHLVSAAAWIGGSLFYILVLRPSLRRSPENSSKINEATAAEFRVIVDTCIFVLLATGIILTFNRLNQGIAGLPYGIILGLKIALSVWMFIMARSRRRRTTLLQLYREPAAPATTTMQKVLRAVSGYNSILILGLIVFMLSDLLKVLFEMAIPKE